MRLEEEIEHARFSGPVGQGAGRVAGPSFAQYLQQRCNVPRLIEADLGGDPVGQGASRVAGSGLAQRPQQHSDAQRVLEADLGGRIAVEQGTGRVAGPGLVQCPSSAAMPSGSSRLIWVAARSARMRAASSAALRSIRSSQPTSVGSSGLT